MIELKPLSAPPIDDELILTRQAIREFIHETPVLTSRSIDELVGANCYFKCENFQRIGAFKMRGLQHGRDCRRLRLRALVV